MTTPITSKTITVANAPCSFGAFELTVGINPNVPDPVALLDQVAATGYAGIDLGPPAIWVSVMNCTSAYQVAASLSPAGTWSCRTPITTRSSRRSTAT